MAKSSPADAIKQGITEALQPVVPQTSTHFSPLRVTTSDRELWYQAKAQSRGYQNRKRQADARAAGRKDEDSKRARKRVKTSEQQDEEDREEVDDERESVEERKKTAAVKSGMDPLRNQRIRRGSWPRKQSTGNLRILKKGDGISRSLSAGQNLLSEDSDCDELATSIAPMKPHPNSCLDMQKSVGPDLRWSKQERRQHVRTLHEEDVKGHDTVGGESRIEQMVHVSTSKAEHALPGVATHRIDRPAITLLMLDDQQLRHAQHAIVERLTQKASGLLSDLDDEFEQVSSLINQTITAGESNSMLLIGGRGCGKSAIIDRAIRDHMERYADEFHVVRLNGFVHTDDKIALREIWRQLGRDLEAETGLKNYADTLTTLLALLSHPSEMTNIALSPAYATKSVIFVLDEFERFASHPRQTLLYNLFDIAQSRKAPIAVLGLTTRVDVAESLEKRVKSRFGHRYVHLGSARTLSTFETCCKSAFTLSTSAMGSNGSNSQRYSVADEIFGSAAVSSLMRQVYYTTKSVPSFLTSMLIPAASMPLTHTTGLSQHFAMAASAHQGGLIQPADSKLAVLRSLSALQLALLVCAARLRTIYEIDIVSLNLAYEEYRTLASKAKVQASTAGALGVRVWGKDLARCAWKSLIEYGLIVEDTRVSVDSGRVDVSIEEIASSGLDTGIWARYCTEI